ncbi:MULTISPECIES: hypothetical protein [Methylomonas]|uniref:Uncharacterized protein n=1 Tax=Methylomonas koyamae TaxID=702114 RepID=A0A177PCL3_9GAMM|nr:hypothetical protein [Methylomonas koyamae]OAI27574.1 hypothetical protein A1355_18155 [Methylomonas koyamae]
MKPQLLLALALPLLNGCAATARSLSSSKVFAPSCPTAATPTYKDPDLTISSVSLTSAGVSDDQTPRCSQKESVYSNAVWIPVLGPLFDLSTNTSPDRKGTWYLVSVAFPLIGPALQLSYGAKQCIAECLPTPVTRVPNVADYFDRALNVSDANCRTFLTRFYANVNGANESKDSLNSLSTITATGAAFANPLAGAIISGTKTVLEDGIGSFSNNYLQGKLMPDLITTIQKYRQTARKELDTPLYAPDSVEDVVRSVNNYDSLCAIDTAVQIMVESVNNQNSGNDKTNNQDQNIQLKHLGLGE